MRASSYKNYTVSIVDRSCNAITTEGIYIFDSEYKARMFFLLLSELAKEVEGELKGEF